MADRDTSAPGAHPATSWRHIFGDIAAALDGLDPATTDLDMNWRSAGRAWHCAVGDHQRAAGGGGATAAAALARARRARDAAAEQEGA